MTSLVDTFVGLKFIFCVVGMSYSESSNDSVQEKNETPTFLGKDCDIQNYRKSKLKGVGNRDDGEQDQVETDTENDAENPASSKRARSSQNGEGENDDESLNSAKKNRVGMVGERAEDGVGEEGGRPLRIASSIKEEKPEVSSSSGRARSDSTSSWGW